jgi:hypothetical protein
LMLARFRGFPGQLQNSNINSSYLYSFPLLF